ncbi:MAG: transcriptional activator domain protein [Mycobacterium sp.]|nr:transcriptional activator domain protein [Mycobacterium sp.]
MSRPLRHAPPVSSRGVILRPRLLALLRTRFERPLTAVVAAAGFGKTTLLAQAVTENALSPLGDDRWLTCQRDDTALSFLAAGAYSAVGLDRPPVEDPHEAAVTVAEAMWGAAPRHVALVLDDAHLIEAESAGGRFLTELVAELPRNGHVVLAARAPLPLSTSRLVVTGDALLLGEEDLQFRADELASFADSRGVPPELLSDVGGWPALAELTAMAGPHAVTGYVWEELLSRLSRERRHALALLVAVGGADEEIAAALLGPDVNLDALLDGLPLVVGAPTGWRSLHGLWGSALQHHLDAEEVAEARRTAAAVLRRRRQYHDAMDLLLDARAWDDVRELVVDVCAVFTPLVPPDVLEGWLRRLPPEVQQSPEGLLLAAMVVEPASPGGAEDLLNRALTAAPDGTAVRRACLNAQFLLAFWRADRHEMTDLVRRMEEPDRGDRAEAPAVTALLRAVLAPDPAQVRTELAERSIVSGGPVSPVADWLHAHIVLLRLGDPAGAEPLARRALSYAVTTMQAQSLSVLLECFRLRGQLDEADRLLRGLLADLNSSRVLCSPEVLTSAVVLLSVLGRDEQVAELLQTLRPTVCASPVAWAPISCALADAFHAVSVGDEERAVTALRAVLSYGVVRGRSVVQVSPAALPLLYVLVPEVRDRWDAVPPPGCFAEAHQVARALVDLREHGSLAAVRALPHHAAQVVRAQLPVPWATELAVAMMAAGRADGRTLLADLGHPARATLRAQSRSAIAPMASAARTLLREIPATPAYRLRLRVLGPLELRRDGALVTAPELRRERVRQLLGYLVVHGRASRAAITAELWPDLDEAAAGRNLRVTLAYLQHVLEPDRGDLDPPYFVRSTGPALRLVPDGALEVDAQEFDRCADEAAVLEEQGAPSAALAAYQRAAALWGGDFLVDVPCGDSLQLERDRLRARFVTSAVRAGHLLLARGEMTEARTLAERALRADEWCEGAYQLIIGVDLATGDLPNALRSLRRCHQMLRELGVPAHQRTVTLGRQLQAGRT